MGAAGRVHILEVEGGKGLSGPLRMEAGTVLDTVSVGTRGQWVVVGPGVLDIHGFLAFDGATLFLRSASAQSPLVVGRAPVPADWQSITPPARISIGGATVVYSAIGGADFDVETRYNPVLGPSRPKSAAPPPSLRPAPGIPEIPKRPSTLPPPMPRTGAAVPLPPSRLPKPAPVTAGRPQRPADAGPAVLLDLPPLAPTAERAQGAGARELIDRALGLWTNANPPRKVLVVLVPVALVASLIAFCSTDDGSRQPRAAPSSTASTPAKPPPPPPTSTWTVPLTALPAAPSSSVAMVPNTAGRSVERLAVDAVVAGAYSEAAGWYEQLAREHPDQPAYGAAAKILRAKADAGAP